MSALSQHLEEYLRLRRLLGHDLADAARLLPRFVDYLDVNNIEFVTVEAAVAWPLAPEAPAGTTVWGRRMMAARGFARYLVGIDPRTEVPPAGLIPIRRRWRPPFIDSEADIAALIDQARRAIRQPLRAATYETLIGLLAATGLRVGEAIRLNRHDIDYTEGVLLVRRSKFGKSRQVPPQPVELPEPGVLVVGRLRIDPRLEKILGWAPRTVYERHYLRIADHATREAILTLYRDDPICPGQLDPPTPPLRLVEAAPPAPLAGDLTRLARLGAQVRPHRR